MSPFPRPASSGDAGDSARLSDLDLLPQRVYRLRVLGMALAAPFIAVVLREIDAGAASWVLLAFSAIVWPQLAYLLARRSRRPYRAELRNLLIDSALAGIWVPLMHFNLLPSVLLVTLATVDKINTGVRGLWLWSLPGLLAAGLVGATLTGFAFHPETSMTVILACMPMLLIHTIAVSLVGYRLVRKVQRQNRMLDELSRIDILTGLAGRGHWQAQAGRMLAQRRREGGAVSLLLIDIDRFKAINDRHGHAVGDDVLRSIAAVIRRNLGPGDCAGRLGGDEFAAALWCDAEEAASVAERIRHSVASLTLAEVPELRVSVSVGCAEADDIDLDLRTWTESADRALYRAKAGGRNRVEDARTATESDLDSVRIQTRRN